MLKALGGLIQVIVLVLELAARRKLEAQIRDEVTVKGRIAYVEAKDAAHEVRSNPASRDKSVVLDRM